jgi:NAD(P)-dependent dehydrogenase (short-subunit alcohol dehydrogenase family)
MGLENPFDFSGKTIVLAGGAGGLGRPISIAFARAGAKLAIWDLNEQRLSNIVDEVKTLGGNCLVNKVDLCLQKEVENSTNLVLEQFRKIDVLVNTVGGIIRKPAVDYPLEEWQRVMDMNLKACWLCCQAVGKIMMNQKRGRIINFASNAGSRGSSNGIAAYGSAKGAIISLTMVLAVEWGPHGVATNAIAPGPARTPINADLLSQPKVVERIKARLPLGGEILPDDAIVGPTLFLASDASRWINGHILYVDAGSRVT